MMAHTPQDDLARDAHLMAALRHAPDRDVAPPPEVAARILAAARAAVAAAPKPPAAPLWQRLAAWLVQPRVGAAFGTLAVATLVGLLWATREVPVSEPAPQAITPALGNAASASGAAAPVAASPTPPPAPPAAVDEAARVAAPAAAPAPRRAAQVAKQAAPAAMTAEVVAATPAVPGAAPTQQVMPATPQAVPPQQQAMPPPVESATAAAERRAAADALADAAAAKHASAAPSAAGSTSGLLARSRQEAAAAAADPLAGIDALLGRAAPGLAWQHAGRTIAHGDAQRQWWAALQSATQGRWRRDLPAAPDAAPPWIELREDGRAVAAWWLDGGVLRLRDSQAQWWSAPVTEAQRRDWLAAAALW